ncbi:MAG TPA: hypothetical protein VHQ24_08285 [Lachnospiraceae bacterium]|nr:hypothetical protein [Lachnospiraceae bacterium]
MVAKEVQEITGIRSKNVSMYADKKLVKDGKFKVEASVITLEQLEEWDRVRKDLKRIKLRQSKTVLPIKKMQCLVLAK